MGKITSVRLSEDLAAQADALATAMDRPLSWVIEQAVQRYVEQEAQEVHAIKEAMDALNAERAQGHVEGRDFEEVMSEMEAMIRAKIPN